MYEELPDSYMMICIVMAMKSRWVTM